MYKIIGNCSKEIDWQAVINLLEITEPEYIGPRHRANDDIIGIDEIVKKWDDSGYVLYEDGGNAQWDMFIPGNQFDHNIVDYFCHIVGIKCLSAWISRVRPGNFVPQHWDANDNEEYYNSMDKIVRFHCHIGTPEFGHIFLLEDQIITGLEQGTIVQWPDRKSWHGSCNLGIKNKYLFNIFGVKK